MIPKLKSEGYSRDGIRLYPMDGGGSSSSGGGTQIQELPEWARPYAKSTLEKGAALSEKGYQAYDQPRIAGFSPMQQQAQQNAANMQTSGATGAGIDVAAEVAGRGLGTNYQAGQFQNQFQAPDPYQAGRFRADRIGTQSFAQPGAAESYMSPYMQNVVDVQQREARRASDIARQGQQAQAVGAGAFGGSRQGLVEAERQRNLATQLGDIQATGQQAAFTQAQQQFNADQARRLQAQQANQQYGLQAQQLGEQSRQFGAGQGLQAASLGAQYGQAANQLGEQSRQYGAGLGLQGLQTALQGAGQLGALGGQQFQQGMDINKLQSAYGGQQQALRQQGLSQAYEDFQNEQNYPYKQLGFMSDLIRGLPLGQQTTRSMYEPNPSAIQQIGALGAGAYGLSKFMAEGGMAYADGGEVQGYKYGGGVDSRENVEDIVSSLKTDQDLQKALMAARARGDRDQAEAVEDEIATRASLRRGIAGGITNEMADRMAGGGVVAFSGNEDTNGPLGQLVVSEGNKGHYDTAGKMALAALEELRNYPEFKALEPEKRAELEQATFKRIMSFGGEDPYAPMAKRIAGLEADSAKNYERGLGAAAFKAIPAILKGGNAIRGIGGGLGAFGEEAEKVDRAKAANELALANAGFNLSDAQRRERITIGREALGNVKDTEAARLAAHTAGRKELTDRSTGAAKVAQAFRPVGTSGGGAGGAGKLPQVDRLAGQIATQIVDLKTKNPNDPQIKVLESKLAGLKDVIAATKTSDIGSVKADIENQKLAAMTDKDIDTRVSKDRFMNADWQEAMGDAKKQAAVERAMRNELMTRRNNAAAVNRNSSNNTPPPPPGFERN